MLMTMNPCRRLMLNFGQYCSARAAYFAAGAGSGTLLLSSTVFSQQPAQQQKQFAATAAVNMPSWRTVEYSPSYAAAANIGAQQQPIEMGMTKDGENTLEPVKLARKVQSEVDKTGLGLRLYQYQTCPYCCKVRAFLDYFGFSYEVVEVNPVTRSQIKFAKGYKKVPILRTTCCDQPLVESSLIISMLATFLVRPELSLPDILPMYPTQVTKDEKGKELTDFMNKYFVMWGETPLSGEHINDAREEREWRDWVDSTFIHLISPNVYRTFSEAIATFRWFEQVGDWNQNFPTWERIMAVYVGASAMWIISKRLKKRHQIVDEREAMRKAFNKFLKGKGADRKFMGGDQPNLADLALYGACNSFYGCPAFMEMRQQLPQIGEWFDAVDRTVKEGQGKHLVEAKSRTINRAANDGQQRGRP